MKNTGGHSHIKHLQVKYHWICKAVGNGKLAINYVPTDENIVDLFIKALPCPQFKKLVQMIGLGPI